MSLTKIKTLAVVLTLAAAASAQFSTPTNARIDAMSGAPVADISKVFRYPALMMGYNEHLQVTFDTDRGGIIGVKSINDMISIGMLANQGIMAEQTRDAGLTFLNAGLAYPGMNPPITNAGPNNDFNNGYNIPHLLLGFDFGAVQLGADIFFEYNGYSYEDKNISGELAREISWYVMHPGVRLSAAMDFGVQVLAKFAIGVPSFNADLKNHPPASDGSDSSRTVEGESAIYMEMGAEVGMNFLNVDWTAGMEYTFSNYQLVEKGTEFGNSFMTFYLGGEFNVLETAVAAMSYSFERIASYDETKTDDGTEKNMNGRHVHSFRAGMENIWDNAWIFDAVALRGGLGYNVGYNVSDSEDGSADPKEETNRWDPGVHTAVVPTLGFGVSKGFFTLDLALDMGEWVGAFVGPPVAMVTGTIKF